MQIPTADAIAADESFYGDDRLQRELAAIEPEASAAHWVQTGMQSVFTFAKGHAQADDITVMALRVLPRATPAVAPDTAAVVAAAS